MIREMKKPRILVVDDVPQNVRLLEVNLKAEGYSVIAAYNGQEALEKVRTEKPDLILLDIMMPGMDGYEVCRRLRADEQTRAIPIIMLTAYEKGLDKKIEALDIGADEFIEKPFKRHEVLARVRSLLRVKSLHDELMVAKNRLEDELMMAREVQMAFMPQKYPDIPGLEFSHKYIPTFAVGGDFFDIQEQGQGVVEIFISDVMGHGPQAAMITGVIKTLLTQLSSRLASPGYLLSQMNERFHDLMAAGGLPMFVTAFCMVIDTVERKYTYSSAGHPAPFLIKSKLSQIESLASNPGPALGMIPNTLYENQEHSMESNDMLFFFTDGLEELPDKKRVQFGAAELHRAISNNMNLPPHTFVEAIMYAADAYADGLSNPDDITLLAVRCNPSTSGE